jgi:hypothetical protein
VVAEGGFVADRDDAHLRGHGRREASRGPRGESFVLYLFFSPQPRERECDEGEDAFDERL